VAERLAQEGCDVAICGRDQGKLAAAARRIDAAGAGRALPYKVDVRSDAEVLDWVAATVGETGSLHIMVTNGAGPVEAFGPADYRDALDTSLLPHLSLALAALPHLRAAGWRRPPRYWARWREGPGGMRFPGEEATPAPGIRQRRSPGRPRLSQDRERIRPWTGHGVGACRRRARRPSSP
jgi:NAD(P)-dependent dehydrogenase (short-subunit alcohol dehydrogenase family)